MTTFDSDAHVLSALAAGAAGFLLKTTPPDRLLTLVKAAAAGGSVLSPEAIARLVEHHRRRDAEPEAFPGLSGREREILALIAEGRTNGEIARRLYLPRGRMVGVTRRPNGESAPLCRSGHRERLDVDRIARPGQPRIEVEEACQSREIAWSVDVRCLVEPLPVRPVPGWLRPGRRSRAAIPRPRQ